MVRAVVALGHTLGLTAIAEGVEHGDQAEVLAHLGCQLAKGNFSPDRCRRSTWLRSLEQQSLELTK